MHKIKYYIIARNVLSEDPKKRRYYHSIRNSDNNDISFNEDTERERE